MISEQAYAKLGNENLVEHTGAWKKKSYLFDAQRNLGKIISIATRLKNNKGHSTSVDAGRRFEF